MKIRAAGVLFAMTLCCGGGPVAVKPLAPSARVVVAAATPAASDDVAVLPSARELDGALIHLAAPNRDLPKLAHLVSQRDLESLLLAPQLILPAVIGEELAPIVDLDAPVEVALQIAENTPFAAAFHVREPDAQRLRGRRVAAGRLRVDGGAQLTACELWHLPDGHRLLCGPTEELLHALAPRLLHASARSNAALGVELGGPSFQSFVRSQVREDEPEPADDVERAAREIGASLILQNRMALELDVVPEGLQLAMSFAYDERGLALPLKTWFEGSLQPKTPPEQSALPGQGVSLAFGALEPGPYRVLKTLLLDALVQEMEEKTLASRTELDTLRDLASRVAPESARFYFASGQDLSAVAPLLGKLAADGASTSAQRRKLERALGSWIALRFDQAPEPYLEAIRAAVKFDEVKIQDRPGVAQEQSATISKLRIASGAAPKGLPRGTLHVLEDVRPDPKFVPTLLHPRKDAVLNHCLFVPDGDHVWIVGSRSEAVAIATARAALGAAPRASTTAAGRAPQLVARLSAAGVVGLAASFEDEQETRSAHGAVGELASVPRKGQTELELTSEVQRAAADEVPGYELRVSARASLDAAAEWIQWLGWGAGN